MSIRNGITRASLVLFSLLCVSAAPLSAQCPDGSRFIRWDCTDRDEHIDECNADFDDRITTIGITFAGCLAACEVRDNPSDCRKVCGITHAAAVAAAGVTLRRCKSRAPDCVPICEDPPPCCPGIDDDVDCIAHGGTWDYDRGCCTGH